MVHLTISAGATRLLKTSDYSHIYSRSLKALKHFVMMNV